MAKGLVAMLKKLTAATEQVAKRLQIEAKKKKPAVKRKKKRRTGG